MKPIRTISSLVALILISSILATTTAIFLKDGNGSYTYTSIRGKDVTIYGKGLYKHMSAEVAPQGLAQDYVTLFIGVPLLVASFYFSRKGSLKGKFLFTGTTAYFLVTYLFYLVMGMYNVMYTAYIIALGSSFFAFILCLKSLALQKANTFVSNKTPFKFIGGFLVFAAISIALLWLSIILPPLVNGSIIPPHVEHYTTLIVQGLDLAILLPAAVVSGVLFYKRKNTGYLLAPVYFIFLSLLMTALTAKIIAMALLGYNVIPAVFIIPAFNIMSIICTIIILKNVKEIRTDGRSDRLGGIAINKEKQAFST